MGSVNSVFDPAGLVTPVALKGKLYQREIIPQKKMTPGEHAIGWDDPLPEEKREKWEEWVKSLPELERIEVPWALTPPKMTTVRQELHVFCDVSEAAIGHVAYLRTVSDRGEVHLAFVCSSSTVAPSRCHLNAETRAMCRGQSSHECHRDKGGTEGKSESGALLR